ncbi:hypothetical protein GCM10011316_28610 [Roseibium aquae]|uniref:VTT domain-containing protein n=1 Tax=Roseibium aquae TaxID=1323746 RepID=A0A916X1L8_9HYPH|nr:hypothetical protein GCM10011316_28610 [Roseibium aquae]
MASFAEATVVPVPLEAILAPLMLLNRDRVWSLAAMATAGCICAAAVGYAVGWLFFETAGPWLLDTFNWGGEFEKAQAWIQAYGFWAVLVIGIVPIPFQTAMLLAGVTGMFFPLFLLATVLSRGARYFGLAALMLLLSHRRSPAYRRKRWREQAGS